MLKTLSQSTEFILKSIKNIDPETDFDEMVISEIVEDRLFDKLNTDKLTKKDMEMLTEKFDDEDYIESYLQWKVPNYYSALEEVTKEVLAEYILDMQATK